MGISLISDPHHFDSIFSESQPLNQEYKYHIYLDQFDFFFIFYWKLFNMINTHLNLHQILGWLGVGAGRNSPLAGSEGGSLAE